MPSHRPKISRAWQATIVAVGIGLLAPLLVLGAPTLESQARTRSAGPATITVVQTFFDKLDTLAYDELLHLRGPHVSQIDKHGARLPSIPEVTIIALDTNSVSAINDQFRDLGSHGPPYPRRVWAKLVRKLKAAGASVIGFDLLFTSPSAYNRSEADPDDDKEFAAALREAGNVVLTAQRPSSMTANTDFLDERGDFPIRPLRMSARAACLAELPSDALDNFVRRFQLLSDVPADPDLPTGRKSYPRFAPMIAALYWKSNNDTDPAASTLPPEKFDTWLVDELQHGRFGGSPIYFHRPDSETLLDPASVNICFAGYPGESCAVRSLAEVMAPDNSQLLTEWFHDKIVLIGSWSIEEHDYVSTPLIRTALDRAASGADGDRRVEKPTAGLGESGTSKIGYHGGVAEENGAFESGYRFGLEVHANAIHSLLDRHYYQDFDERKRVMLVWMCGLITALLVARLRPVRALPAIVALLGIIWWFVFFSFRFYVFLRPIQIGLATVLAYGLETVYFYGVENRRAVRARNTFQRYVGPRVMASVLDTNFKPGSVEQRHLTIMFTDVQGFTSLSEKMPPQEVVATFNRYLNQMVEIIDKYGGTLDKIMGDGVMAYFNAPLPVEHHEQKAVECALEMQAAMRSWRELAESLGLPPLKVRIGINCGDVVFGEVGAKRQLGYTVIGDAVNAAARLEPLNKEFGTEILISEAVLSELDGTFETHYVGELAIRGREEGIRAYSVTGRKPVGSDG